MPSLIDVLPEAERENAYALLERLVRAEGVLQHYNEELKAFKEPLASVNSEHDFFALVQQIIEKERDIHTFLGSVLGDVKADVVQAVQGYLEGDERFVGMKGMLSPEGVLTSHIIATKEKLSEATVYEALNPEKSAEAREFIAQVKGLNLFKALLDEQKEAWKVRLNRAESMKQVDAMDDSIQAQNDLLSTAYKSLVTYPEDEETAGALIPYLEANPQLLSLMSAFDGFHESLEDDILAARMQCSSPAARI